ncbi:MULTISPECIES: hypothetical protein [unclassified Nocardioides]|uniref:hypothetical protein n=1 Tax=unclassified Nocardioides TaxID=2615069 RepID=UPI0009F1429B|nr:MULTISPECIES: hypothetical protein [unclassified Nocardioides]GAW50798.1 uncharacterized protein PD653B2_3134 [Nocardioides sp. PD653-B2]GAW52737.1 uncharacterized protein PD653_0130 [Nocardioides sp. PD653]
MSDDVIQQIQQALDQTGVYVDPTLRAAVGAHDLAAMKADVAASPTPTYVVVYPYVNGDQFGGDPAELLTQLHDASGKDGLYLSVRDVDYTPVYLESRAWGSVGDGRAATDVAAYHHPDDAGAALAEATHLTATGTAQQAADQMYDERFGDDTTSSTGSAPAAADGSGDDGGGGGSGVTVGVLIGLALAIGVVVVGWRVRRRTRRTYSLPASVVEHVREAHDRQLEDRAQEEVLALGEAIDAAEMSPGDTADAWQAALDHYDGAGRVLRRGDDRPDVLDVVGALVLARRERRALDAALGHRAFEPEPVCYLNPLHTGGTTVGTVESGGRQVEVPLCRACRADLRAGRAPDVLDVMRRGRPVHYFDTDAEPWASTGYGALRSDLVPRLQGRT